MQLSTEYNEYEARPVPSPAIEYNRMLGSTKNTEKRIENAFTELLSKPRCFVINYRHEQSTDFNTINIFNYLLDRRVLYRLSPC